ncbi:MAG: hypothetical protein CMJ90_11300 [Planctomycetes bacterium]|nr:hypothetical protein [Planctomycetota bacterium]
MRLLPVRWGTQTGGPAAAGRVNEPPIGPPDMKSMISLAIALAFLTGGLLVTPALAQGEDAKKDPGLKDAEIKKLGKLLADLRAQPKFPRTSREVKKKEKAQNAFSTEIEKVRKSYGESDILSYVDSWSQIFQDVAAGKKAKNPAGKGRVKKESVSRKVSGRERGFEYGVYVPPSYNSKKRYPLILALHTKGSTGSDYLKEVWINKKRCPKTVYDQFIFVAPTIGERTIGKNKKYQKRIEAFSRLHLQGVAWCLVDVLQKYNIDTDRMYLDGAGFGGETAAWLGTMQTKLFAGMAIRNAKPAASGNFSKPELLTNLKNQCAMLVIDRKDGVFADADGQAELKRIETVTQADQLPIEVKVLDALPDPKSKRLALGKQKVDPIHDATPDIAKFFLTNKRNPHATELAYLTYDNRLFRQASWYIIDRANANPADGSMASVKATLDRENNVATFQTHNVESFRVYLNDVLLDLDKPIKVVVNGKDVIEKKVDRSLDFLLDYNVQNSIDPALVMVGVLRVNVPSEDEKKDGDQKDKDE